MESAMTTIKLSHEVLSAVETEGKTALKGVNSFGISRMFLDSPASTGCSVSWPEDKEDASTTMSEEEAPKMWASTNKNAFGFGTISQAQKIQKRIAKKQAPKIGANPFGVKQAMKTFRPRLIVVDGVEKTNF